MINLKKELELLYQLQYYDIEIKKRLKQINEFLVLIKQKQKIVHLEKHKLDVKKKDFLQLTLNKNAKELELNNIEQKLNKYFKELNNVKSNSIYSSLLIEINKVKLEKSDIEDQIIAILYKIDNTNIMHYEYEYETNMKNTDSEIQNITLNIEKLQQDILNITKQKDEYRTNINAKLLLQYDKLYKKFDGTSSSVICVCLIKNNSCERCGMILRPQLINQVEKYKELVFCDNCSCILITK